LPLAAFQLLEVFEVVRRQEDADHATMAGHFHWFVVSFVLIAPEIPPERRRVNGQHGFLHNINLRNLFNSSWLGKRYRSLRPLRRRRRAGERCKQAPTRNMAYLE
jgi:hypothetical protein